MLHPQAPFPTCSLGVWAERQSTALSVSGPGASLVPQPSAANAPLSPSPGVLCVVTPPDSAYSNTYKSYTKPSRELSGSTLSGFFAWPPFPQAWREELWPSCSRCPPCPARQGRCISLPGHLLMNFSCCRGRASAGSHMAPRSRGVTQPQPGSASQGPALRADF